MSTAGFAFLIGGLLLAEAFFALSEIALISANRERLRARAEGGSMASALALRLLTNPERVLATTLIATNLCLVGSSFASNELAARTLGPDRSWWAIAALVPFVLVFAEILPKTLARRHADALSPVVAYPVRAAMLLLGPIALSAGAIARALTASIKGPGVRHPFVTKEELRAILKAERRAALDPDEARLINRLLGMAAARSREIMTPLPDVVSVAASETAGAVMEKIRTHGYSRLPVYQDRTDNIVGVVHAMDLIGETDRSRTIQSLTRRPFYVPEAGRLNQLLDEFRRRGHEMAIVVDEFGAASGIVTIEDVLEELVGDILDEFDRPHREILEPAGDNAWTADGTARLNDLGESLGVAFPRGGYETLAGLMAHRLQRIPRVGDQTQIEGFLFRVLDATERRVRKVRIERPTEPGRGETSSPGTAPS